jgi:hypothetical protein
MFGPDSCGARVMPAELSRPHTNVCCCFYSSTHALNRLQHLEHRNGELTRQQHSSRSPLLAMPRRLQVRFMPQTYGNNNLLSISCVCGPLWLPVVEVPVLSGPGAAALPKRLNTLL